MREEWIKAPLSFLNLLIAYRIKLRISSDSIQRISEDSEK